MRVTEIVRNATSSVDSLIEFYKNPQTEPTPAMIQGSVYHALFFEQIYGKPAGAEIFVICKDDYRTKEAQNLKAEALAKGQLPILQKDYFNALANVNQCKLAFRQIIDDGVHIETEVKGEIENFGECIGHIDLLSDFSICDLKITTQAKDFNKIIFDSGYQLQLYLYAKLCQQSGLAYSKLIENLKIIFFNPNSLTFNIKTMSIFEIKDECEALLKRAFENHQKAMQGLKEPLVAESQYQPPLWAYKELLNSENLGF